MLAAFVFGEHSPRQWAVHPSAFPRTPSSSRLRRRAPVTLSLSLSDCPPALTCFLCIKGAPVSARHVQRVTRQAAKNGVGAEPAEEAYRGGGRHGRLQR